jgi:hypothetical protein
MPEVTTENTRVRLSYKISAKGNFQPDITSEAIANLKAAKVAMSAFAAENGYKEGNE